MIPFVPCSMEGLGLDPPAPIEAARLGGAGCGSSPYGQISELQVQMLTSGLCTHAPCVHLYAQTCAHGTGDAACQFLILVALTEDLVVAPALTWWLHNSRQNSHTHK